jgi:CBS domain containing-hemolysin-like protein
MAEEGSRLARRLLPTLEEAPRLDRHIAACQVGITISSLVLGAYGQATLSRSIDPLFERWAGLQTLAAQSASTIVVLVGLTTLQMVLGELVPKSLALQYPTRLAVLTVLPMHWAQRLLSWFITILNGSGWIVLRLVGVEPKTHRHLHSAEEIRFLVAESREGGHLAPEEERRLGHALGLTQRTARELMVPRIRVVAVELDAGLDAALDTAASSPYTRLPVYRDSIDGIIGVVHAKDLAAASLGESGRPEGVLETLVRPVLAIHEATTADRVLALMRKERGVMAVVIDDHGGTSGILTTEDILTELLGDMADELKHEGGAPQRLADGRVRLPGGMSLYDVVDWIGTDWEGRSATVSGLVMECLGRVPAPGDTVTIDGLHVEVEQVDRRVVRSVLVEPLAGAPAPEEGGS